ncbi:MAG: hypothetical protein Q8Q60_02420 [Candidatus Chromulinivorax sp.]|nr:hypothetical protein [Candidatus Chromulinivorax sp.]
MLFHKKLVVFIVMLVAHSMYASQENQQGFDQIQSNKSMFVRSSTKEIVNRYQLPATTQQQIAFYKSLEKKPNASVPLYFFHDEDLDGLTESSKKLAHKSLYARYNNLPEVLQDNIMSFLVKTKWSNEKDPRTGVFKVIEDEVWKKGCRIRFKKILSSQRSILTSRISLSWKETEFIKKLLRIEYWLRFVRRARHEHAIINNRMEPSALVSEEPYLIDNLLDAVYFDTDLPEDIDIEFIGLIIGCGVLVNQKKNSCSLLVSAIKNDDVQIMKLLRKAGLRQPRMGV